MIPMPIAFLHIDGGPRELPADDIHVWSAPLDRSCDIALLTPDERVRADRFKMERIRRQFVAARVQMRIILGGYLGIEPGAVPIVYLDGGKPVLDPSLGRDLHFNVSHSEALAIYAVTRAGRVGVDVERRRNLPNPEALVERFFSQGEREIFRNLPECERQAAFFCAWTRKEAVLKAVGQGVQSLDQCDVTFCPGEPEAVLRMGDDWNCGSKWLLRSWEPEAEFVAAVAVELRR